MRERKRERKTVAEWQGELRNILFANANLRTALDGLYVRLADAESFAASLKQRETHFENVASTAQQQAELFKQAHESQVKRAENAEKTSEELVRRLDRAYEALVGANLGHEAMIAMLRANAQRQGGAAG